MKVSIKRRFLSHGQNKRRAGWLVGLFFLALMLPTLVLVYQAYSQLKWEAFYNYRALSEELALRIDKNLAELIAREEARSFAEYSFIVAAGNIENNYIQRSPLSELPHENGIPGFVGYFQIDPEGRLTSPLLPPASVPVEQFGLSPAEMENRRQRQERILSILSENQLVSRQRSTLLADQDIAQADEAAAAPADSSLEPYGQENAGRETQAAFDKLASSENNREQESKLGRLEDLQLDKSQYLKQQMAEKEQKASKPAALAKKKAETEAARASRKERILLPEAAYAPEPMEQVIASPEASPRETKVRIFESEIDPFEVSLLDSGHFVIYRKVWRDGSRYIQGFLLDRNQLVLQMIESEFRATVLSNMSNLAVAFRGNVLAALAGAGSRGYLSRSEELTGALLYQTRLSAPFDGLELLFTVNRMPVGKGAVVVFWSAGILLLVLLAGCWLFYRMVARQMELAAQQQDFVSSVSHELRTPLTSIRMYGEMLKQGWASEEKKKEYYDFIYFESERLTRLINNVLQLARMTRNDLAIELKPHALAQLADMVRSKISSQVERAGFVCDFHLPEKDRQIRICVDVDMFVQIVINLVDNAIKFSAKSEIKKIDIGFHLKTDRKVLVSVRDYGPGIPDRQLKKIFTLFYRLENEMTRETTGTGIGLALVNQLASAMNGKVDVVNKRPGAEFSLEFPVEAP